MESFNLTKVFSVNPETIYNAWLDSEIHSEIVGSKSVIDPKVNGRFSIWDGYITGWNVELLPNQKIIQNWRTSEFPEDSADSILEIELEEHASGTRLKLTHSNIPDGQSKSYKQGWIDYYFEPMKEYFENKS